MGKVNGPCPSCGAETEEDGDQMRAFVRYQPDPNDGQTRYEWGQDMPVLFAIVCRGCGYIIGVIDEQDPERAEERVSQYRVDEELE